MKYLNRLIEPIKELNLIYYSEMSVKNNELSVFTLLNSSSYVSVRELVAISELINHKIYSVVYTENIITIKEKI
ncbi:MAG: hypothetical protein U9O86_08025 [Campylobacterota bacterium]|nr:hypothetical protein [Campylobacterota bacterium]